MNLSQGPVIRPKFLKAKEDEDEGNAEREPKEEPFVLAVFAEDFDGTNGAPEDGRSEECIGTGALETHGRVECADSVDAHLGFVLVG